MLLYLVEKSIDNVDAWAFYYDDGVSDFTVGTPNGKYYKPVFMFDEAGCPTDFIGWNYAN